MIFVSNVCFEVVELSHCILVDSSTVICWTSPYVILGLAGLFWDFYSIFEANSVDPDQRPHYVASDLGLHCLPMSLSWVSRKERVKELLPSLLKGAKIKSLTFPLS